MHEYVHDLNNYYSAVYWYDMSSDTDEYEYNMNDLREYSQSMKDAFNFGRLEVATSKNVRPAVKSVVPANQGPIRRQRTFREPIHDDSDDLCSDDSK